MTVNPGWGGQSFIQSSPDKVERLVPLVGDARIEVDGGIDTDTAGSIAERRRIPLRRRLRRLRRRRPGRGLHGDSCRRRRRLNQPRAISAPVTSCHHAFSAASTPGRSARRSHQPANARRPPTATIPVPVTA